MITLLLPLLLVFAKGQHKCVHDDLQQHINRVESNTEYEDHPFDRKSIALGGRRRLNPTYAPIRITPSYQFTVSFCQLVAIMNFTLN